MERNTFRYADGKTPAQEARDSAQMLGSVLIFSLIFWTSVLIWAC